MRAKLDLLKAVEAIGSLLGNPYDAECRKARDLFVEQGLIPGLSAGQEEWIQYWRVLPPFLRDKKSLLALLVGCSSVSDAHDMAIKSVALAAQGDIEEGVTAMAELAYRARAVTNALDRIVGNTEVMRQVRKSAWAAAFGDSLASTEGMTKVLGLIPILICGETGTGKELLGQALGLAAPGSWTAKNGTWTAAPFEALNLASVPANLVADALFGHVRGAHSMAHKPQDGVLQRCHRGAVFLDEIAELPRETQVALLRCLQEGKVRPLGAPKDADAAPRLISATHADLGALVEEGAFRHDLYHRLSAVVLRLPPLRERRQDIVPIAERILVDVDPAQRALVLQKVMDWSEHARDYEWPGNVRELASVVRLLAIGMAPTPQATGATRVERLIPEQLSNGEWSMEQATQWYARLVRKHCLSTSEAAKRLGIHRDTLTGYLKAHGN